MSSVVVAMSPQRQNSVESVMEALRILIADDHPAVRILLRNILETVPQWKVCGEAQNGSSAVTLASRLHLDVIVMDLVMPEINGLEATRQVLRFN